MPRDVNISKMDVQQLPTANTLLDSNHVHISSFIDIPKRARQSFMPFGKMMAKCGWRVLAIETEKIKRPK